MTAIITAVALSKTYGLTFALRKLDVSIAAGQFVALLGPNGSGKSTFLRLLTGLSRASAGSLVIGGWEMPREADAVRAQIGVVSHKALLYDTLTARENLRFFAALYHLPRDKAEARINALLEQVGLARRAEDLVRTYSRGMLQRLSIARALLHAPDILLLDEPHTGLDRSGSEMLDTLLRAAHAEGRTVLMATHELERAAALSTRVLILARGTAVYDAPTAGFDGERLAAQYAQVTG
ncbi:MAG: heme ABC exporter ATP-binding protein CcmA [Chloroflexi bacterium]|nr:heme ABC exporter ATP-binding protein CcmA [Chloroflexota bacterium]